MWIAAGIATVVLLIVGAAIWFVGSVGHQARKKRSLERAEASKPDSQVI